MTSSPVYAALDLGSNSFHLLVATFNDEQLVVIDSLKVSVQLAAGLQSDKTLSPEAISRALDALALFADRLQAVDRRYLRVTGTSTLRQAKNADTLLEQAERLLNAPIDIISGVEEARLIYLGVSKDYSPQKRRLIIDIGGGSTECVVGRLEPEQLQSLHLGCVSLTRRFFADGRISRKRYQKALTAARLDIQDIAHGIRSSRWKEAVGASGTIRAVHDVLQQHYQQPLITLAGIERLAEAIQDCGHCDALDFRGLSDSRRNILAGGLAILHALFIEFGIREMHSTDHAIREGIIYEMAGMVVQKGRHEKTIRQLQQQYRVDVRQAERVSELAQAFLAQLDSRQAGREERAALLGYAAALHEIGLPINHNGYQKHGAYIVENSFMPGFSRQMQQSIAYLVGNHRRKIRDSAAHYRVSHDKRLLIALRLAFLFCRRRSKPVLPKKMQLAFANGVLSLAISDSWLQRHPMSLADLQQEAHLLHNAGVTLLLNGKKP